MGDGGMTIKELLELIIDPERLDITGVLAVGHWSVLIDEGDGERSPVEVIDAHWDLYAKALILRIDG